MHWEHKRFFFQLCPNVEFKSIFPTLSNGELKRFFSTVSKPELKRVFPTLVQRKLRIFFPTLVQRELWWCSQCWCNFSAPTIIICTKPVPSAQFWNTKNGARLMHLNKGGKFAHLQGIFEEGKKAKSWPLMTWLIRTSAVAGRIDCGTRP